MSGKDTLTNSRPIAVINRSFWPVSDVLGEGLLRFCELLVARDERPAVITQSKSNLDQEAARGCRGEGVTFHCSSAFFSKQIGLTGRVIELLLFSVFVIRTLLKIRPKLIYVSTDPPILVPLIVAIYCRFFRSKFIYHLQDIHPEAACVVTPLPKIIKRALIALDSFSLRQASTLITINSVMAETLRERIGYEYDIIELSNGFPKYADDLAPRSQGFVYCGNLGRLQKIALLSDAIVEYHRQGGTLEFHFAGDGVYKAHIEALASRDKFVHFIGRVSAEAASSLLSKFEWALLPIEGDVTKFAFPSKTAAYLACGTKIMCISESWGSVSRWVEDVGCGLNVEPTIPEIVSAFQRIERGLYRESFTATNTPDSISLETYSSELDKITMGLV